MYDPFNKNINTQGKILYKRRIEILYFYPHICTLFVQKKKKYK